MSRVYEALQRSQGDKPNSPLVPEQPEAAASAKMPPLRRGRSRPVDADWLTGSRRSASCGLSPTPEQRLVVMTEPESTGAEMFRVLATRLAHMQNKRRLQKLLITSAAVDEGKSVVAANLALTLARRPQRARSADRSRSPPAHRQRPVLFFAARRHYRMERRQDCSRALALPGAGHAAMAAGRRPQRRRSAAAARV